MTDQPTNPLPTLGEIHNQLQTILAELTAINGLQRRSLERVIRERDAYRAAVQRADDLAGEWSRASEGAAVFAEGLRRALRPR